MVMCAKRLRRKTWPNTQIETGADTAWPCPEFSILLLDKRVEPIARSLDNCLFVTRPRIDAWQPDDSSICAAGVRADHDEPA